MSGGRPEPFELYKLYLATAEKVSDRRAAANTWLLSINSAIVALYGLLYSADMAATFGPATLWTLSIPVAGIIVCIAWRALLASYGALNAAKFAVLHRMEEEMGLSVKPFADEERAYESRGRGAFSKIEARVPVAFGLLHALLLVAAAFVHLLPA